VSGADLKSRSTEAAVKLPAGASIVVGFAPYIAFFIAARAVSVDVALWAALAVAALNAGRDWAQAGSLKLLEAGTVLLFAALAAFTAAVHFAWTLMTVRLAVDAGLLAIVLASLAIDQPFTLQYARERAPQEYWKAPLFISVNRRITAAWAAAFMALVAAHAAVIFVPGVPVVLDLVVTIAALASAVWFSTWYPARVRKRSGLAPEARS